MSETVTTPETPDTSVRSILAARKTFGIHFVIHIGGGVVVPLDHPELWPETRETLVRQCLASMRANDVTSLALGACGGDGEHGPPR